MDCVRATEKDDGAVGAGAPKGVAVRLPPVNAGESRGCLHVFALAGAHIRPPFSKLSLTH